MKLDRKYMLLYAITDSSFCNDMTIYEKVELALQGGATCLQIREKTLDYDDFLNEAKQIQKLCKKYNVPLIINDNVDLAIEIEADGVHVGQDDMDVQTVRKKVGSDMIIGVSTRTPEQAIIAQNNGADYIGVGAMFSTKTRKNTNVIDYSLLSDIRWAVDIPIVLIGGIKESNIYKLKGIDADGVAVVSDIFGSDDIKSKCERLYKLSKEIFNKELEV